MYNFIGFLRINHIKPIALAEAFASLLLGQTYDSFWNEHTGTWRSRCTCSRSMDPGSHLLCSSAHYRNGVRRGLSPTFVLILILT